MASGNRRFMAFLEEKGIDAEVVTLMKVVSQFYVDVAR